jgi:LacI family transcriptional regulator
VNNANAGIVDSRCSFIHPQGCVNNGREERSAKPTMRTIAAAAQVSLGTVHHVLNPGPRRVAPELRSRVMEAMRELGYEPAPRQGRQVRPLEIGVVLPSLSNPFWGSCVEGIQRVLAREGHVVLAACHDESVVEERRALAAVRRRHVDGLIFTPCWEVPGEVRRMAERGVPVTILDRSGPAEVLNCVVMDIYESSFDATRLLVEHGYRRVALINGPDGMQTSLERRRGYVDALARAGIEYVSEYEHCGPWSYEHGHEAMAHLAALPEPPQACFISSPMLTLGALMAMRERHLAWPDDVALVGYGDPGWAAVVEPPLTVVEQPVDRMGEAAAGLLLASIRHSKPTTGQKVTLGSQIVLRQSHWRT